MNIEVGRDMENTKKSYHAPELIALGSIPAIVQNLSGNGNDANQTPSSAGSHS